MKKTLIATSVMVTLTFGASGLVQAATEQQKLDAIEDGLAWMAASQQIDGSWNYGDVYGNTAATAAALLAFQEQKTKGGGWFGVDYQPVVDKAYAYILNKAQVVNISPQGPGGINNPDTNGDGVGVKFVVGGANNRDTYVTGLVLPALVKYGDLNATITTGALAGQTFKKAIQNTVDYFAFGQNDTGYAQGAWRYYANSGDADNSTAQWPVVGMMYAEAAGATVPAFVKTQMQTWINYIQNPSNGGSGYDGPYNIVNESKTGGLLLEMEFASYFGTSTGPTDKSNYAGALEFLNSNWKDGPSATWDGNFGHPYSMWSVYKGLESTIGLTGTQIANFMYTGAGQIKDDSADAWNWWEDYCQWLVSHQQADGSWAGYDYWGSVLATPWYINILNGTSIPDNPVPEPSTMLLFGAGLMGLTAVSRRRRR